MPAALALVSLLSLQAPGTAGAAPAATVPMAVRVDAGPKADAAVEEWARELRAALGEHEDEFRLVRPGEKAEFVVRIESVGKTPDGTPVMNGVLVRGGTRRSFSYTFTDVKAQAAALARNLRKYADQMKGESAKR